jgi:iron complex outermembrane receptor protein
VQSFDASGAGGSRLQNAGETTTAGIEMNATWEPTDNFSLVASALFLEAEFKEFDGVGCYPGQTLAQGCTPRTGGRSLQDVSGGTLPNAPRWKFNVLPRYETSLKKGGSVFVQALASFQDEVIYNINQDPNAAQDAYTLVDLSAGYKTDDGRYTLTFFVKNALDEFYVSTVDSTFLNDPGGYYQIVPRGARRMGGAELSINF